MARLDPEIETSAMAALDNLVLSYGPLSSSRRIRVAVELGGAVMERSPSNDFISKAADGSLRNCEIRSDAVDALRVLSATLRDRISVLIECERWQQSLARNWMAYTRFRRLTGVTTTEFCQPGWLQGCDVSGELSHLVVGARQAALDPASAMTLFRVYELDTDSDDADSALMTWDEVVAAVLEAEEVSLAAEDEIRREITRLENLIGRERVSHLRRQRMDETMARAAEEGFYVVESDLNRLDTGDETVRFELHPRFSEE